MEQYAVTPRVLQDSGTTVKQPNLKKIVDEGAFFNLQYTGTTLDEVAIEVGLYFGALTICMLFLLDQLRGKPYKIKRWLLFRKLEIFKNQSRNSEMVTKYLTVASYFYIVAPFVVLGIWVILLMYDLAKEGLSVAPAFATLLVGLAFIITSLNLMKVKWNNFRVKPLNMILMLVAFVLVSVYQGMIIFGDTSYKDKFFPYSAFFLNFNVSCVAILVFFDRFSNVKDVLEILMQFFPNEGESLDPDRDTDLIKEVDDQAADPEWRPNMHDLKDVVTVSRVSGAKFMDMLGSGMIHRFKKRPAAFQVMVKGIFLGVALLFLAIYSLLLYFFDDGNKMGIVISVSVVMMDIFTYVLTFSRLVDSPPQILFLLIINRALMIAFGKSFWILGFYLLYIIYALTFVNIIARNNFPFADDIVLRSAQLDGIKKMKMSFKDKEGLRKNTSNPLVLLVIVSAFFILLMIAVTVMEAVEMSGMGLQELQLSIQVPKDDGTGFETKQLAIGYVGFAGLTILLVFSFYFIVALFRIMVRKAKSTDLYSGKNAPPKSFTCYCKNKYFDVMQFYMGMSFIVCCMWSGIAFWVTRKPYCLVVGTVGPLAIMLYARGYVYLSLNDFDYFQSVDKLNKQIDTHNKNIEKMEMRKAEIQQQLLDGTLMLPKLPKAPEPAPPPKPITQDAEVEHEQPPVQEQQQEEEEAADPEMMKPAPAQVQEEEEEEDDGSAMQEMIERERQKKLEEEERRRKDLEENAALKAQEDERRKQMEEQLRREKEEAARKKAEHEAKRKAEMAETAKRQREEEAARRKAEQAKPKVEKTENMYNFSGQAQMGTAITNRKKPARDDEIYEGGQEGDTTAVGAVDEGAPLNAAPDSGQVLDPTKTYINRDQYEEEEGGFAKIASTRLYRVTDWRLMHKGAHWSAAYAKGDLRPNDVKLINAMLGCIGTIIIGMAAMYGVARATGFISVLPFCYLGVCITIGSAVIYQSRTFSTKEIVYWTIIHVLYGGCGAAFFVIEYEVAEFSFDVENRDAKQQEASYFVLFYVFLAPTVAHGLIFTLRIIDRGMDKFDGLFKVFIGIFCFGLLMMIVCVFLFHHWIEGVAAIGALIVCIYAGSQVMLYIKNSYKMNSKMEVINKILVFVIVIFAGVFSAVSEDLSSYHGISLSTIVLLFFLWSYSLFQFTRDFREIENRPVFYSPSLFPIYKYNDEIADLEPHYGPAVAWIMGLILLLVWGYFTNVNVTPQWFGAAVTIAIQLLIMLSLIYLRSLTIEALRDVGDLINDATAKKAWIFTKKQYFQNRGVFSRADLVTYRRAWVRRYYIEALIACNNGNKILPPPKTIEKLIHDEVRPPAQMPKQYLQNKVNSFLPAKYDVKNDEDLLYCSFVADDLVAKAFAIEQEQVIQFIMMAVQNSVLIDHKMKKDFMKFLQNKSDVLHALGIDVQVPSKGALHQRWDQIQSQIDELGEKELKVFKQLQHMYETERAAAKLDSNGARDAQRDMMDARQQACEEAQRERERQLAELRVQVQQSGGEENVDINMDIDSMPDCRLKYNIIVKRAKAGMGKFTDTQFPATNESIGQKVLDNNLAGQDIVWNRMGDKTEGKYVIFEDGIDCNDIRQGALGDCYFLSSLSVLGNLATRDKFIFVNTDDEWQECGAVCVKFYEGGKEQIVIIDDHLPVDGGGEMIFTTSPSGFELWPMFLEKAFAKKYGSYEIIEGGLVDKCLAELTNGVPETYYTEEEDNVQDLWNRTLKLYKEKHFLGAGSPNHPNGDSETSGTGIVQGHAYSILRLVEADGHKLIQIRNPWGRGEWTGDWGDDSELWTTRMMNLCNYEDTAEDGVFWMDFNDYVEEFTEIYVCRVFNEDEGWKSCFVEDEWAGNPGEGIPTSNNRGAKMENNPNYGINCHQPGKGYFILRMLDKENSFKAKEMGYFSVQNQGGKLIKRPRDKELAQGGPGYSAIHAKELKFPDNLDYPVKLTALVASMAGKPGRFTIQIYSKDQKMSIEKLNLI